MPRPAPRTTDPASARPSGGARRAARATTGLAQTVLVLRSNPRDSSLRRTVTILASKYHVDVLAWDRQGDLEIPVTLPHVRFRLARLPSRYYDATALLGVIALQPWFVVRGLMTRPAAVHAMDLDTGVAGWVVARCLRVPLVYQCLDPYYAALPAAWPAVLGRLARWVEDRLISAADLFVITDERRLAQHPTATPRRLVEMVNAPLHEPDASATAPTHKGLVVGYIGSLVPHRGLRTLIRTVGAMADDGVSLVIGGFGPMAEELEDECRPFPNVVFRGWVADSDMPELQASFDVFVQVEDPHHAVYRWVSPNKLFDSMAYARPIIVAEGTLAAQTVAEVGHGMAVRYGDAHALEGALRHLMSSPSERLRMAQAGRRAFLERWSPAQQRQRVLAAYGAVLPDDGRVTG